MLCKTILALTLYSRSRDRQHDAPTLLKLPKSDWSDIWTRVQRHKWLNAWQNIKDPVVLLERNLYLHSLAGLCWERPLEKVQLQHGWEKVPTSECLSVHRQQGLFVSKVYSSPYTWTTSKWLGKSAIWIPCVKDYRNTLTWRSLRRCGMHSCKPNESLVDDYRQMFESRMSAGATVKLLGSGK